MRGADEKWDGVWHYIKIRFGRWFDLENQILLGLARLRFVYTSYLSCIIFDTQAPLILIASIKRRICFYFTLCRQIYLHSAYICNFIFKTFALAKLESFYSWPFFCTSGRRDERTSGQRVEILLLSRLKSLILITFKY